MPIRPRNTFPRSADRLLCSAEFQRQFDRFMNHHQNNYATLLARWEEYTMMPNLLTSKQLNDYVVDTYKYNMLVWRFRALVPPALRELLLRRRQLLFIRMCAMYGRCPYTESMFGFCPGDSVVKRLYFIGCGPDNRRFV